jgi:hypothetical protein
MDKYAMKKNIPMDIPYAMYISMYVSKDWLQDFRIWNIYLQPLGP